MRLNLTFKVVTWLTVALFAPLAFLSYGGQVLCVGEDDHMQVELTGDSCCDLDVSDSGSPKFKKAQSEESGCGDCSDLHLDLFKSVRIISRSTIQPELVVYVSPVWSVTAVPFINYMSNQILRDEYSPGLSQAQLSVSIAILIC